MQVLGMEWRAKPEDVKAKENEGGEKAEEGQGGKDDPGAGQELFFIETRWKVDDIVVRMNLQLYRVDETNYLVDFRNVGYIRMQKKQDGKLESERVSPVDGGSPDGADRGSDQARIHEALDRAYKSSEQEADSLKKGTAGGPASSDKPDNNPIPDTAADGRKEVCSPFLFLECATRLIVELAGGG